MLTNCLTDEVTRENIELALKENRLLWLDLDETSDEVLELLRDVFKVHPLAVGDACRTLTRLHTDRRLVALYRLLDALVDTMFPYLAAFDDRIDEVQDE